MKIESCKAVVLARGGSKRIPRKNLQEIRGVPLVVLASQVGVDAGIQTFVSSDDTEILDLKYHPSVTLYRRSSQTALDDSSSEAAVLELADNLKWDDETEIVLLPPTSPMRTSSHLTDFLLMWKREFEPKGYNQALSVALTKQDFWTISEDSAVRVRNVLLKRDESRRSQEREPLFIETSAIYLTKLSLLRRGKGFTDGKLALIPLPKIAAIDIDDLEDLEIASILGRNFS